MDCPQAGRLVFCVQANYQQFIPNSQFNYCIIHKLLEWKKSALAKFMAGFVH